MLCISGFLISRGRLTQAVFGMTLLACAACRAQPASAQAMQQQPVASPKPSPESTKAKSCHAFVQSFYDWYIAKQNSNESSNSGSSGDEVLRFKSNVLSVKLRRMLKKEYATDAKMNGHLDLQLEFDPYINSQDDPGPLAVRTATYRDGKCRASVWFTESGSDGDLVDPELVLQNGNWVFINFHYPDPETPSEENLVSILLELRNEREHAKSERSK